MLKFKYLVALSLVCIGISLVLAKNYYFDQKLNIGNSKDAYFLCISQSEKKDIGICLRNAATTSYKQFSISQIESSLEPVLDSDQFEWCHEFMHYLGWEIGADSSDLPQAFSKATPFCSNGMFHGIVENFVNENADQNTETLIQRFVKSCDQSEKQLIGDCYHGLGHGFMYIFDNNLQESALACSTLLSPHRADCYAGAFMEVTQPKQITRSNHSKDLDITSVSPDYPCDMIAVETQSECYLYRGDMNYFITKQNASKAFELCSQVTKTHQNACYQGVGYSLFGKEWNIQTIINGCSSAFDVNKDAYHSCVDSVLPLLFQFNNGSPQMAQQFCNSFKNTDSFCGDKLEEILKQTQL